VNCGVGGARMRDHTGEIYEEKRGEEEELTKVDHFRTEMIVKIRFGLMEEMKWKKIEDYLY
jgi:hypothetical protein